MAAFFINRPIFAWVVAIMIMLAGALSLRSLPIAQYPDIASPQISVSGQYPGASAQIAEQSVTQIIEQQMRGLDNLLYMRSSSDSYGNIEMTFTLPLEQAPTLHRCRCKTSCNWRCPCCLKPCSGRACRSARL